jgi:hypothetical protein
MTSSYQEPLNRLMKLGAEPARRRTWPDYRHLGLGERHVPGLIQIALDPELHAAPERDPAAWAPVHAWRALAQIGSPMAVSGLLELLEREIGNGWVHDEVPAVLGMIGPAALTGATLMLFDEERPEPVRLAAARAIADVAHEWPERSDEAAALLAKQLEDWPRQTREMNAVLVAHLIELEAKEAAEVIGAAFAADAVDPSVNGDWEDVQLALGLIDERTTPPTPWSPLAEEDEPGVHAFARTRSPHADAKSRQRRKAAKASRKRNRKRK